MSAPVKVDMHVHLYPEAEIGLAEKEYEVWEYGSWPRVSYSKYPGTVANFLEAMESSGVVKAVLLMYFKGRLLLEAESQALDSGLSESERNKALGDAKSRHLARLEAWNRWGCEVSRAHPQISTFVTVDLTLQSPEEAAEHFRTMAESHSARGLKLHSALQGFSMSDERLWPLYSTCQELGLPVLGHGGPDREGRGISDPKAFSRMLQSFPDMTVVLAHMGGAAWRQTAEVGEAHPNLVFDCSEIMEWTGAPNAPTDLELATLIKTVGPGRVMMGSDFPWYDLDHSIERVMALPLLSNSEKEAMLGENALRILRL